VIVAWVPRGSLAVCQVDDNTGVAMYESDDIIRYLFDTYGDGTGTVGPVLCATRGFLIHF
jgi:hypothetical protein